MTPRLIALDIDGTLLDERSVLRDRVKHAVARASAGGLCVMLCSGRSYLQAAPIAKALGLAEPMGVVGGALVRHSTTREVWHAETFPADTAAWLVDLLAEARLAAITSIHRGDAAGAEYVILRGEPADAFDEPLMTARPDVFHFTGSAADLDLTASLRITVSGTPEHFDRVNRELDAHPHRVRRHVIRAPDVKYPLMEIFPPHVHKWSAVLAAAQRLGVPRADIVAVGDDANDLQMVTEAGLGVAMGNAIPELKAVADRVIGANSDDGLARFLDELAG